MKKTSTKNEPVYVNRFIANIKSTSFSKKEAKLLNEMIRSFDYDQLDNNLDTIKENLHIGFAQCIVQNKIQPLTILERLKKIKATFAIELAIGDRTGKILRKVNFSGCEIKSIRGLQSFALDAEPQIASPVDVGFLYKKIKIS